MKVDFLETLDDGQVILFTLALEDGKTVVVSGNMAAATSLKVVGIEADEEYMKNLCVRFDGCYLRATKPY